MHSFLNAPSNDSSIKFAVVIWNNFHVGCDHIVIINIKFYLVVWLCDCVIEWLCDCVIICIKSIKNNCKKLSI